MDIQSKVAARRAELARAAAEEAEVANEQAAENRRREKQQRDEALHDLTAELARNGAPVTSDGAELSIAQESPLAPLDRADFKRKALQQLLNKEARRRFTPGENWYMIAPVAAGVVLLPTVTLLAFVLIGIGCAVRYATLNRYRRVLRSEFPKLFNPPADEKQM